MNNKLIWLAIGAGIGYLAYRGYKSYTEKKEKEKVVETKVEQTVKEAVANSSSRRVVKSPLSVVWGSVKNFNTSMVATVAPSIKSPYIL